ncbi:hypothetical protein CCC_03753 [Paramagnetospirillum magnetotacticum MS-1]|uniref:DUF2066 domain-containing protein n=1 Tax=Paramagnetospirillum magnetotacticum MS-1 TaxID=272627 RepID=A0A0C2YUU4_PARME|nr:DUF2066 domain-containing protein [Paramagnetospirillum magnetotacticum]KIL98470.1 hypothetical protein CCC_03753 [Paramagnetospirillum magnetotacticum MS-1]
MSSRGLRLAWLVLGLFLTIPGAAWAADAFAVHGLEVDVTAQGVAAAKEQAMNEAQRTGFRRLLERLTMPADHARLPSADAIQYVRDVAIEYERSSAVRYIASLTVRYNPVAVKKLLRDANIKYAEPRPRPVVIVPVFRPIGAGRALLWEEGNPWRAAWAGQGSGALVPLVIPASDMADVPLVPVEKALAGDVESLSALGARFRTPDVLVMTAMVNGAANTVEVTATGMPGVMKPFDTRSYPIGEAGTDAALRRAVAEAAQTLDSAYKQSNLLSFDRAASMAAMVPLKGLDDWVAVRERLGRVTLVRRWEIVSLSREEAAIMLYTVGEPEQVKTTLAAAGLQMDWNDGYWVMRLKVTP